ncbi:MAG: RimK family protein [Cyclobacteriaceae bacterium]|nr:RimK family protein [Cyclobacteriaceae bacterium]
MLKLIVVDKPKHWNLRLDDVEVITPGQYITQEAYQSGKNLKVLNLCKSYQYQSEGYYVSLLAEARGHKVLPEVSTIQDFRYPSILRDDSLEFDDLIQATFRNEPYDKVEFNVYFGQTQSEHLNKLALQLFQLIQAPLVRASFSKKTKWVLQGIRPVSLNEMPDSDQPLLESALEKYLLRKRDYRTDKKKYDLAILINPEDPNPPSDDRALKRFYKASLEAGFNTEFITKNDFDKLIQYDALLIRETTNVNHHTFRFAKKAEALGLAVIDDPESISKCSNKVYLHELLNANKILTPHSLVLTEENCSQVPGKLNFPFILKQPDGAFSKGVVKIHTAEEFEKVRESMFEKSDLIIAQEFLPTPFDWRVGIIDGQVIFVCKYFMATKHWQIVNWSAKKETSRDGSVECVAVDQAPAGLLKTALKAASLIGKGLYGVDMKEVEGKFYVIEVNDNPNIDAGIEDKILKDKLYDQIMEVMMTKIRSAK